MVVNRAAAAPGCARRPLVCTVAALLVAWAPVACLGSAPEASGGPGDGLGSEAGAGADASARDAGAFVDARGTDASNVSSPDAPLGDAASPDLDGPTGDDASTDATFTPPTDAGGPTPDAAPPVTDAGTDAANPPAGAWAYVHSVSKSVGDPSLPGAGTTVAMTDDVLAGDLVFVAVGSSNDALSFSFQVAPAGRVTLNVVPGQVHLSDGPTNGALDTLAWGVAASAGPLTVTAGPPGAFQFLDGTLAVYRGGSAGPHVVDGAVATGGKTGTAETSCPSVQTQAGGVAYWMVSGWRATGSPMNTAFTVRQDPEENPTGDVFSAAGQPTPATTFVNKSSPDGAWECQILSISP